MGRKHNDSTAGKEEDTVFLLRVHYRRNTSWQGIIQCLNTRRSCVFRSVLELGALIFEELSGPSGKSDEKKSARPHWDEKESVS